MYVPASMWNYIKPSEGMRLSPVFEPSLRAQLQHFMTHVNTVVNIPSLLSSSDQHDMQVRPQCGPLLGALQALGTQLPGLAGLSLQGAMGTLCQGLDRDRRLASLVSATSLLVWRSVRTCAQ